MGIAIQLPDDMNHLASQFITEVPEQERNNALRQFIAHYLSEKKFNNTIVNKKPRIQSKDDDWEKNLPPITKKYFGYFSKNQDCTDEKFDDIKLQYLTEKHGRI